MLSVYFNHYHSSNIRGHVLDSVFACSPTRLVARRNSVPAAWCFADGVQPFLVRTIIGMTLLSSRFCSLFAIYSPYRQGGFLPHMYTFSIREMNFWWFVLMKLKREAFFSPSKSTSSTKLTTHDQQTNFVLDTGDANRGEACNKNTIFYANFKALYVTANKHGECSNPCGPTERARLGGRADTGRYERLCLIKSSTQTSAADTHQSVEGGC